MTDGLAFPDPPISFAGFHLRPWATRDVPSLVAAWLDPDMHRWMPEEADPFDAEHALAFVEDASKALIDEKAIALAIAEGTTYQAVGSVTLHVWGPRRLGHVFAHPRGPGRGRRRRCTTWRLPLATQYGADVDVCAGE